MNFGDILDRWEKQPHVGGSGIYNKDADEKGRLLSAQEKRRRLRNKKPDAELDIHNHTRDESWQALEIFFGDAKEKGFEKVLIIHGKGNHSSGESVLKRVVMDFIEHCTFAGESGKGKSSAGGDGATWVLLKKAEKDGP